MSDSSSVIHIFQPARSSLDTARMRDLEPGGAPYLHDHTQMKTRFSIWIAIRRKRMGKPFRWEAVKDKPGFYSIWID